MDLVLFIYLASVVDGISKLLLSLGFVLIVVSFVFLLAIVSDKLKDHLFNKLIKYTIPSAIILFVVVTLIPSERTMYLMGGVYLGQQIIKSDTMDKVSDIINLKLDNVKNDLIEQSTNGDKNGKE